jgi:hypothetical protein
MRFTTILVLFGVTGTLAAPAEQVTSAASTCGNLGVMAVDASKLPAGVDPKKIRTCRDHPTGITPNPIANAKQGLDKRNWGAGGFGCASGFCWTRCSAWGGRCWSAFNHGFGEWAGCGGDWDCGGAGLGCGRGCGGEGGWGIGGGGAWGGAIGGAWGGRRVEWGHARAIGGCGCGVL